MFTCDNAPSNDKFMEELEALLDQEQITFDRHGNRIRYNPVVTSSTSESSGSDPVGKVRDLVAYCRQSDRRRIEFRTTIEDGNKAQLWKDEVGNLIQLPLLQLLRDCETRWSSTFLMIKRALHLYPISICRLAIKTFLSHVSRTDISHTLLRPSEYDALKEIYQILEIPHDAQQLLSYERTPSLTIALPAYELLLAGWRELRQEIPHMATYINTGIQKIEEYVNLSRRSRIHALAMALNPAIKLSWMEQHWSAWEAAQAREWLLDAVCTSHNMHPIFRTDDLFYRCKHTAHTNGGVRHASHSDHLAFHLHAPQHPRHRHVASGSCSTTVAPTAHRFVPMHPIPCSACPRTPHLPAPKSRHSPALLTLHPRASAPAQTLSLTQACCGGKSLKMKMSVRGTVQQLKVSWRGILLRG
ncbi:hypothetical protein L226DRAFT_583602 [Lentinus tigrinus ALCF2SS1-7]|nr:hypothetical protein L226DRAFT_583602 [Lentinus tigrinus ALCF2SS1-7]